MTPDQVHELGLKEVERIGAEMEQILQGEGLTEGTIGARVDQVSMRPDQLYPDTDEGRAQALKDYQSIIDEISAGLDPYFSTKPKAKVEVKRVPVFAEKTAPQAYYQPGSFDGARNGAFFANLRDMKEIPKLSMRTLSYHEAVPGHHFQISIAQELKGLPIFRQVIPFTAYVEGWALYTERLAWEAGFEKNPLDNLGRLRDEMFRACRLVVDTGMHAKHWTREQAITYMIDHTGMGEKEIVSEVERYLVIPGQALAYKVGMLKILELRDRARDQLGDKYDIREFHEAVLKNGAMPLTLLERVVDEYIAKKKARAVGALPGPRRKCGAAFAFARPAQAGSSAFDAGGPQSTGPPSFAARRCLLRSASRRMAGSPLPASPRPCSCDVGTGYPLGAVLDAHQSPMKPFEIRLGPVLLDRTGIRHVAPTVERIVEPEPDRLFGVGDRFLDVSPAEKQTGRSGTTTRSVLVIAWVRSQWDSAVGISRP
jgi:hypothetical protein